MNVTDLRLELQSSDLLGGGAGVVQRARRPGALNVGASGEASVHLHLAGQFGDQIILRLEAVNAGHSGPGNGGRGSVEIRSAA